MNKIIKLFIILTAALLLAWLLPLSYQFIFSKPFESPLTLYSPVKHDFLRFEFQKEDIGGYDMDGNSYTMAEFDSLMPTVNYFQLNRDGRLPKEVDGVPFNLKKVEHSNFAFRSFPRNYNYARAALYQLVDGATIKDGLRVPDHVFRMTGKGLEFILMENNAIDKELSERFTSALLGQGFVFPAKYLDYDDNMEKKYDNGFLMIDQKGGLFQLKRVGEQPVCRHIALPDSIHLTHTFVTEYKDRKLLGFLRDEEGGFYALETNLSLHKLPIPAFDPEKDQMIISGDMLYWNVIRETSKYEFIAAIDANDYHLVKTMESHFPTFGWEKTRDWIFPFRMDFTSGTDRFMKPRLSGFSWEAILLNSLLAMGWFFLQKRLRRHSRHSGSSGLLESAGILVAGWFLFIPLLLTIHK